MQTKLIIIRHGITDWSLAKRYCGWNDVEINNIGKEQALKLGERIAGEKIDAVYTSSAKRAHEFAEIAFKGLPITVMAGLKEMDFGIFEGLTYGEIMQKYPDIYSKWVDNPCSVDIPEGESMKDFKKRIGASFKEIIRQNKNKQAAVVTHAGVIKVIISDILKIEDIWKAELEWGAICAVLSKEENEDRWVKSRLF